MPDGPGIFLLARIAIVIYPVAAMQSLCDSDLGLCFGD